MRVLITGVSGFVGRHLVELARSAGAEVFGVGRRPTDNALRAQLANFAVADLNEPEAIRRVMRTAQPDRVFHLAGQASVDESWTDPRGTIDQNITTSLHLLEAVRREAPDAHVLVSCSGDEYGPVPDERLPIGEAEPLRPQNPYAVSKAAVDLLAGFYADAHGLAVVRARSFNHCGPGQPDAFVVASFARQIAEAEAAGRPSLSLSTGSLRPRRDFSDVRDVVRAYWLASELASPGAYNVCSGLSVPIADILATLAAQTAVAVDARTDPRRLREHEVMDVRGSHDKLTEATGWQPEIRLETTLADTLEWWRGQTTVGAER